MKFVVRLLFALLVFSPLLVAADMPDAAHQITPEALAQQLSAKNKAPLILNVGPRTLYDQAHIRGAEYVGAASTEGGLAKLRERANSWSKSTAIVLYCGCCPWDHCPNVGPAFTELEKMGFTNVKVMYVAHNIGADWVDKGYPVEKGK